MILRAVSSNLMMKLLKEIIVYGLFLCTIFGRILNSSTMHRESTVHICTSSSTVDWDHKEGIFVRRSQNGSQTI